MSSASRLPTSTEMKYFDWKGDPHFTRNPAIDGSGTYTLYWSVAPLDSNDAIITGGFEVTSTAKDGENYTFWVPASAVSADGLSATGCVGGIRPNGLDYTTGDTTFAPTSATILTGMKITCGIPAVLGELLRTAIQGGIQTGSVSINLGTGSSEDAYIYHNGNPWLKQTSAGVAQYWNGSSYVNLNDSIASSLVKVSGTDTTPDYLYNKVGSSDGSIVFDVTGDGADETLDIVTALPARITSHAIYTPAYMTGGTSAETNTALWDSVTDGSFRLTLDGTTYNITGINFTGITTMAQVASTIQTKLQTVTGTTATVAWSTNKFIITSTNTTSASAVSVLTTSTASVGTDISGAGAGTWMDSETGRGTATAAVLNPAADSGKIGLLNARGSLPADLARDFVDPLGYQAKGGIMVATAANVVDELAVGANDTVITADSAQSTGVKYSEIFPLGSRGRLYYNSPLIGVGNGLCTTRSAAGAGTTLQPFMAATSIFGATGLVSTTLTDFTVEWIGVFTGTCTLANQGLGINTNQFDDDYNTVASGSIRFHYDGANTLRTVTGTASANTANVVDTGYAVGEKRLFRIRYTTTAVYFYINNVLVATHTTNIPTVTLATSGWGLGSGGTGAGTHGEEMYMPNVTIVATDLYTT